jgi:hypothetical protein
MQLNEADLAHFPAILEYGRFYWVAPIGIKNSDQTESKGVKMKSVSISSCRKFACLFVVALLTLAMLAACGGTGSGQGASGGTASGTASKLTGDPDKLLTDLAAEVNTRLADGSKLPQTFDDPVTAENCEGVMGLSAEELSQYVDTAFVQVGAINTSAHSVVIAKCKNAEAAKAAADICAKNYNSNRWICVVPDTSFLMVSGEYLLVASCSSEVATAIQEGFSAMAGGAADQTNVFFTADKAGGFETAK